MSLARSVDRQLSLLTHLIKKVIDDQNANFLNHYVIYLKCAVDSFINKKNVICIAFHFFVYCIVKMKVCIFKESVMKK